MLPRLSIRMVRLRSMVSWTSWVIIPCSRWLVMERWQPATIRLLSLMQMKCFFFWRAERITTVFLPMVSSLVLRNWQVRWRIVLLPQKQRDGKRCVKTISMISKTIWRVWICNWVVRLRTTHVPRKTSWTITIRSLIPAPTQKHSSWNNFISSMVVIWRLVPVAVLMHRATYKAFGVILLKVLGTQTFTPTSMFRWTTGHLNPRILARHTCHSWTILSIWWIVLAL